jgi:hypothetical protein
LGYPQTANALRFRMKSKVSREILSRIPMS